MRVLIADDNQINRQFVTGVLDGHGHQLEEACDGREAVSLASAVAFDLVLMDLRMPEMDGIEAANAIRQLPLPVQPVIVALTADLHLQQEADLREQGFDACLSKPVSGQTLLDLLARYAGSTRQEPVDTGHAKLIDTTAALAAAGGNRELLDRLLQMLGSELDRFVPQIRDDVTANRLPEARELTHKLRGSAGYTGATGLQAATAELELALTRGSRDEIDLALDHLLTAAEALKPLLPR